jgi:hypothetical protein
MIKCGSRYYIFSTGNNIPSKSSADRINWSAGPTVFTTPTRPAWISNAVPAFTGSLWAPDIMFTNGLYYLYYSVSSFGSQVSAIGLVTNPTLDPTDPSYQWTDQGPVIQSDSSVTYNTIDPGILMAADGRVWMSFGSFFSGIKLIELDPATGKRIATNSPLYALAVHPPSTAIEGSDIVQHGNFYYLFVNWDTCCQSINSTYNIRVGRSTNVTGPYLDRTGNNMATAGGGTLFLESTGRFIGPGHAGVYTEGGTNWFTYHYYDGNASGSPTLGMGRLYWDTNNWPQLTNDWCAFYTMEADAREHRGVYNGQLQNGATITNEPGRGRVLSLNGTNQFASLPLSVANASTFATWVKWNGGADLQHIYDFGSNTTKYIYLTPRAANGKLRFGITTGGVAGEKTIDGPSALPIGAWCHVAVTLDGTLGLLYLNGDQVGLALVATRPWQVQARSNYLAKSQGAANPYFNGMLDSLRIYGRALSAAEIKALSRAQPSLAHRYSFNADASDTVGFAHGSLMGNALVTNKAVSLDGTSGNYVNLPGGIVSGCSAVTLEFWATLGANGNWARVFDFGNISGSSGQQFIYFSPHTGVGTHRLSMSVTGTVSDYDAPGTLDGQTICVACIEDPSGGYSAIYTNGVLEQSKIGILPALSGVSSAFSFLGRSLFSADAWLNGRIDEFRIYDGRLGPADLAADYAAGPDSQALPVNLSVIGSAAGVTLSWPSYALGFSLESTGSPGPDAVWSPVVATPVVSNGQWQVTLPPPAGTTYYHLRQ